MSGELPKLLATCRSQQELKSVSDAYAREAQGKATILDNILLDRKRKQAGLPIPTRTTSKPPVTKSNISAALASLSQSRDALHHDQTERAPIRRYPLQPIEKPTPIKPPPPRGPAATAAPSLGNGTHPIGPAATSTVGVHGQIKGRSIAQQSARSGSRGHSRESPEVNQIDGVRRHRRRRRRKKREDGVVGGSGAPSADGGFGKQQHQQPGTQDVQPRSRTRQDSVGRAHNRIATPSPSPPPLKRNRRKPAQDGFPDYSDTEEARSTPTAPKETAQWRESYGSNPGGAAAGATAGATTASEMAAERSAPLPLGTAAAAAGKSVQQQQQQPPPPMAKAHFIDYGKGERESRRAALEVTFRRQLSIDEDEEKEEEEDGDDDDNDNYEEEEEEDEDDAEDSGEESEVERTLPVVARKNAEERRERDVTLAPTRRTASEASNKKPSPVPATVRRRLEVTDGHIARRPAAIAPVKAPPPQQNEEKEDDEEEEEEEEEEEGEDEEEEQKHQKKVLVISSQKRVDVDETAAATQRTVILASQDHSGAHRSSDVQLTSTRTTNAGGSRHRQQDDGGGQHESLPTVALKATTASSKVVVGAKVAETSAVGLITDTKRETRARDTAARAGAAAPKEASVSPHVVAATPPVDVVSARRLPPIKQAQRGESDQKPPQEGAEARRGKNGGRDGLAGSDRRAKSPHSNVAAGGPGDSESEANQRAASVSALAKRLSRLSRSRSPSPVAAKAAGAAARNLNDTVRATGSLPELGTKKTRFQEGSTPPQQQQSHNQGGGGSKRRKKKRDMEAYVRALEQIVDSSLQYIIASTGEKLGIEQPLTVTKAKEKAEKASRASKKLRPSVVNKFLNGKYSKRVDAFLAEVE